MPRWQKIITARKDHKCIICRQIIPAGTKYLKDVEQEGDGFVTLKMHPKCEHLFDDYMNDLREKVEKWEESSVTEPLEFIDVETCYVDTNGDIAFGE